MNPSNDRATLPILRNASRRADAHPLVCPCGGEVTLAGIGFKGAVRCDACQTLHASLASLVRKGEVVMVSAAEAKRQRKCAARLAREAASK